MAYIGRNPAIGTQKVLDSLESQFNGSLTTFDLRYGGNPIYPTLSSSLIVSVGGVLQEPGEAYYVSSDTIVFSQAPATGLDCWILLYSEYGAAAGGSSSGGAVSVATGEPMGHEDRTDSAISFDNASRTFTIAPASGISEFVVWTKGTKRTYSTAQTVQIGTATGLYYIYFDAFGVLQYRTTYFDWDDDTPTAYVYWNATSSTAVFVADERHGIVLDWQTHEYLHRTRGAVIASGFSISNYTTTGDGSANADAQFDLANGTFFDEDLEVNITHSATPSAGTFTQVLTGNAEIPVYYMSGSEGDWVRDTETEFACKQSGTTLQYNSLSGSTWSTTAANDNRYVVSWVVATNEISAPVIVVLGQDQYSSIGAAEEAVWGGLTLTNFPIFEFRPLWKVIFRTNSTFTNTPNAYIANVLDLREFSSTGIAGTIVSDHGLLSGLADDDHAQYLNTTVDRTGVTANITTTGNISAANLIASGQLQGPANFVIDPAAVGDDTGTVEIKGNLTVQGTTTTVNSTTTTVNQIKLGDNDKALFGDGDDLQIYHSGSNSYIDDVGTGNLILGAANFQLMNVAHTENYFTATNNGSVQLYYDANLKLETTSTGINVQGDIRLNANNYLALSEKLYGYSGSYSSIMVGNPSDIRGNVALAVDTSTITGGNFNGYGQIIFTRRGGLAPNNAGNNFIGVYSYNSSDSLILGPITTSGYTSGPLTLTSSGNVGIGTDNPSTEFEVLGGGTVASFRGTGGSSSIAIKDEDDGTLVFIVVDGGNLKFQTSGNSYSDKLVITPAGNVGIGTTNPLKKLHTLSGTSGYSITNSEDNYIVARFEAEDSRVQIASQDIGDNGSSLILSNSDKHWIVDAKAADKDNRFDIGYYDSSVSDTTDWNQHKSTYFTIKTTGNVGIGTDNPSQKLVVYNGNIKLQGEPTNVANLIFTRTDTSWSLNNETEFRIYSGSGTTDSPSTLRLNINHSTGHITPGADATQDFGSPTKRWANIYSADLQLSNEGSANDVDGTWGAYTIQEGEEELFLINRRSGKKFKFVLEEVK